MGGRSYSEQWILGADSLYTGKIHDHAHRVYACTVHQQLSWEQVSRGTVGHSQSWYNACAPPLLVCWVLCHTTSCCCLHAAMVVSRLQADLAVGLSKKSLGQVAVHVENCEVILIKCTVNGRKLPVILFTGFWPRQSRFGVCPKVDQNTILVLHWLYAILKGEFSELPLVCMQFILWILSLGVVLLPFKGG